MPDSIFSAASLSSLEQACSGVLILTEGIGRDELQRSRLTLRAVLEQLAVMAGCVQGMPAVARSLMPELGWDDWELIGRTLAGARDDDTLWFAVSALVPATMMWLRVYRQEQPGLFAFTACPD